MKELLGKGCANCGEYIRTIFDMLNEGIALNELIYDEFGNPSDYIILDVNSELEKLAGLSRESIIGRRIKEILPQLGDWWFNECGKVITTGAQSQYSYHKRANDKHYIIKLAKVGEKQFVSVFTDVTQAKSADDVLHKYQVLFDNAQDIVLYVRMDGTIADANQCAVNKYGYTSHEILTKSIHEIRHHSTMDVFEEQMRKADSEGIVFESLHVKKDGTTFPVEVSARSAITAEGRIRIHIIRDITERKAHENEIAYLASYDSLTGVANRAHLLRSLTFCMENARRSNRRVAVMLFDIDNFKAINDSYGHSSGDAVLKMVAERTKNVIRKADVVGRLGGDEFVVIQTDLTDISSAFELAGKIKSEVSKQFKYKDTCFEIKLSIGISIFPDDSQEDERLLHYADIAMYKAKQSLRGVVLYCIVGDTSQH